MNRLERFRRNIMAALVAIRKDEGLTQAQVAERMGVSQSTVSDFEASTDPRLGTLQRYARALGCQVSVESLALPLTEEDA